jgi:catechol 2,3-dioxygenase-like lactoylglutathione lyase family enzyme
MERLDHIVINTRDRTDQAVTFFENMGFIVTPRGYHTMGSINNTIVFKTDYLELLGYPGDKPPENYSELTQMPVGLMSTVVKIDDADNVRSMLTKRGLLPRPVASFSRPLDLGDGKSADVSFRVTRLEPDTVPGSWVYYCQHLTPELVWRPEWQEHANGCVAMTRLVINVSDLQAAAQMYTRALDVTRLDNTEATCCIIYLPNFEITLTSDTDKRLGMYKLVFGTHSLDRVAVVLAQGGIGYWEEGGRIIVDSMPHIGCVLEFESIALL